MITILKRERVNSTSEWGDWFSTTDVPPYTNTDLIQYKVDTVIDIDDVTNATTVDNGEGTFDVLMRAVTMHIDDQYSKGRLTGTEYATVYLGSMQSAMSQGVQWAVNERLMELKTEKAEVDVSVAKLAEDIHYATKQDKINTSLHTAQLKEYEATVANSTIDNKINMVGAQLDKIVAEKDYVVEQDKQLELSVQYNNMIKAADSLADIYGTFGAGGLNLTYEMWQTYFSIVSNLSTNVIPSSLNIPSSGQTNVTKVS